MPPLPIETSLPQLRKALESPGITLLQAPPGAGKTTRVPLDLLEHSPWLTGKRIIMLEPRRLAARAAAAYMSALLNESVGRTVGYQVRLDRKVSRSTRVEVVTEGLLTGRLQNDPALENYGVVIFDEIHERSLESELALALCRDTLSALRPDLRILLMSATMDTASLSKSLDARIVTAEGHAFPVTTEHIPCGRLKNVHIDTAAAVEKAIMENNGDVLVFLPGMAEINATRRELLRRNLPENTVIHMLHGSLPLQKQNDALREAPAGKRKIILATSIAETSLTIEGIRCVIDSGWMRTPRFSPRTGMTRLETIRITRDSADQRRGRAGRTAPGHCIRLWTRSEDTGLIAIRQPEIENADLTPLALQLALWGVREATQLNWLSPPPDATLTSAHELLSLIGAISPNGQLTPHGNSLAKMPMHPRLAHMILLGRTHGNEIDASLIAALLSERDPLPAGHNRGCGISLRLELLTNSAPLIHPGSRRRILSLAKTWQHNNASHDPSFPPGALLALAYPDRLAKKRKNSHCDYLMANGRGAYLDPEDPLCAAEWIVAAHLNDKGQKARVLLGCEFPPEALELFRPAITVTRIIEWDEKQERVLAVSREQLGAITLSESPLENVSTEETARALMRNIFQRGIDCLNWTPESTQWLARVSFLRRTFPEADWPDTSENGLKASAEKWLLPILMPFRSLTQAKKAELISGLKNLLSYDESRKMNSLAPERIAVPSGSKIRIDYSSPETPVLAVRIQELFGMLETPGIADGKIPLLIHLLSPAQRPIQITNDLKSFWLHGYSEARKELRGRYPKHDWPENPSDGIPSRRIRKRK